MSTGVSEFFSSPAAHTPYAAPTSQFPHQPRTDANWKFWNGLALIGDSLVTTTAILEPHNTDPHHRMFQIGYGVVNGAATLLNATIGTKASQYTSPAIVAASLGLVYDGLNFSSGRIDGFEIATGLCVGLAFALMPSPIERLLKKTIDATKSFVTKLDNSFTRPTLNFLKQALPEEFPALPQVLLIVSTATLAGMWNQTSHHFLLGGAALSYLASNIVMKPVITDEPGMPDRPNQQRPSTLGPP